jgi:hypothetical protein
LVIRIGRFLTDTHPDGVGEVIGTTWLRLDRLAAELAHQAQIIREQQKTIQFLKEELAMQKPQPWPHSISAPAAGLSGFFGGSVLSNPNISLVLDAFAYASNLKGHELEDQTIPGLTAHGLEQRTGFNVREAELFIFAPVDPYFNLYVNLPVKEDGIALEEACAVTTSLPEWRQIKGGKVFFLGAFGDRALSFQRGTRYSKVRPWHKAGKDSLQKVKSRAISPAFNEKNYLIL